ncbi:MAG: hypothetical protein HZA89_14935 [Verrucomicrobia bacterium]|nr:hypothetical protein [Verrucomicrobiota bacterium]
MSIIVCLSAPTGRGQTNNAPAPDGSGRKTPAAQGNGNSQNNGKGKPGIASRPTVIPRDSSLQSDSGADDQKGKPASPGRSDKTPLPTEVSDLVRQFQQERESYLNKQKAMARLNGDKDATSDERAALRAQMKENLERLKEQHKALVKESIVRIKEIKGELNPDLGRLLDGAQKEGR